MKRAKICEQGIVDIIDYEEALSFCKEEYQRQLIKFSVTDKIVNEILKKDKQTEEDIAALATRQSLDNQFQNHIAHLDTYKEYVVEEYNGKEKPTDIDTLVPKHEDLGDKIVCSYELQKNVPFLVDQKIKELKQCLADTDYQITKLYEAQLEGGDVSSQSPPIIAQRKSWRQEINRLEKLLKW